MKRENRTAMKLGRLKRRRFRNIQPIPPDAVPRIRIQHRDPSKYLPQVEDAKHAVK